MKAKNTAVIRPKTLWRSCVASLDVPSHLMHEFNRYFALTGPQYISRGSGVGREPIDVSFAVYRLGAVEYYLALHEIYLKLIGQ